MKLQLGEIKLEKTAALAPMAGAADRAFREICAELGACWVVGEMASAKGLSLGSQKTAELLLLSGKERPGAVQLFGDEPDTMASAAVTAAAFNPDAIDVNMGCPAPKVTAGGGGCALMKNLPLAGEIVRAAVNASGIPVTVKIRKGWDDDSANAVEAAVLAEENGAAAVTVHGRTRQQMYAPPVDLGIIAAVKKAVSIPVIGNGDITDIKSAVTMYEKTGCDLVMIGRGALGSPWIFRQLKAYFTRGVVLPEPEPDEKIRIMLKHVRLACIYKGERAAMREARKHAAWYFKGLRGAAALRRRAGSLEYFEQLEDLAKLSLKAPNP